MTISGLSEVSSRGGRINSGSNSNVMGKDDFLYMLVAQLKAQDPLNPMDGTAFTAQLAQFSSLEQLQNINANLETINTSQAVLTNSQAVEYIGKTVTAVGDSFQVIGGRSQDLHFTLGGDAAGVYVRIYDEYGNYINQIETGFTAAGDTSIAWNGQDYLGGHAPDGTYYYEVAAINESGNSVPVAQYTTGVVTGVSFTGGMAFLQLGDREIPMGNVVRVEGAADI